METIKIRTTEMAEVHTTKIRTETVKNLTEVTGIRTEAAGMNTIKINTEEGRLPDVTSRIRTEIGQMVGRRKNPQEKKARIKTSKLFCHFSIIAARYTSKVTEKY